MKKISNKVYKIDPTIAPVASVLPGEVFTLELQNAFGKSFETVSDFEVYMSAENAEERRMLNHPCTGPIEIITDQTNISLAVEILDCKATRGYQCISKSTGLLKRQFQNRSCEIFDVCVGTTFQFRNGDLRMNRSPKIGFVATVGDQVMSAGRAGRNGGNLDFNYFDKKSIAYLPVNFSKPLLLLGDLHICQGNGEAAGIAIEADGEVTLRVHIIDKIDFPVINHKEVVLITGFGDTLEEALQCSVSNTITYLKRIFPFADWSTEEIYKFISAEGNLILGNSTGTVKTCGTVFVKKRIMNKFSFSVF